MSDLTEKWKAGELKEFYGKPFYIKKQNGVVKVDYLCQYGFVNNYDVVEVMAPCDYDDLVYLHKAKNDAHEIVESLTQENTQLKELLKECEHMIIAYSINNNTFTKEEIKNIISKIDQVLGAE